MNKIKYKRVFALLVIVFYLPLFLCYSCAAAGNDNVSAPRNEIFDTFVFDLYAFPLPIGTKETLSGNALKLPHRLLSNGKGPDILFCAPACGYIPAFFCIRCFELLKRGCIESTRKYIIRYIHDKDGRKNIPV